MDGMFICNINGYIMDCNGASLYMFKANSRDQLCSENRTIFSLIDEKDKAKFDKETKQVLATKACTRFECKVVTLKDEILDAEVLLTLLRHHRNVVLHVAFINVSNVKEMLEKQFFQTLVESNAKLKEIQEDEKLLFENAGYPLLVIDSGGVIVRCNKEAERELMLPREELCGKEIDSFFVQKIFSKHSKDKEFGDHRLIAEVSLLRKKGEKPKGFRMVMRSAKKKKTDTFHIVCLEDITELQEARRLIRKLIRSRSDSPKSERSSSRDLTIADQQKYSLASPTENRQISHQSLYSCSSSQELTGNDIESQHPILGEFSPLLRDSSFEQLGSMDNANRSPHNRSPTEPSEHNLAGSNGVVFVKGIEGPMGTSDVSPSGLNSCKGHIATSNSGDPSC